MQVYVGKNRTYIVSSFSNKWPTIVHSGTLLLHCASTIRQWKIWLQVFKTKCVPARLVLKHSKPVLLVPRQSKSGYCRFCVVYTAISRKIVGKNVHATIPKGNMGYNQYIVPDIVAVERTFSAYL